jgi:hypothetical protein
MINNSTLEILAVAFGLGLLVGLQREKAASEIAGIRTFPLITLKWRINRLISAKLWWLDISSRLMLAISAMLS